MAKTAKGASDADTLWAAVRAAPLDPTPKLVLADYLEKNGNPDAGHALRWCVGHDRWPRLTPTLAIWNTDPTRTHPGKPEEVERAMLPFPLFVVGFECEGYDQIAKMADGIAYRSLAGAIDFLGFALAELRRLVSPEPDT